VCCCRSAAAGSSIARRRRRRCCRRRSRPNCPVRSLHSFPSHAMDGVQNPHDEYVNQHQQWVDLGNMQQQQQQQQHHHHAPQHHPLSPHQQPHHQDYGAHYGYVESPGFAPPDSPFRLQPPPMPMTPTWGGLPPQWGQQTMPPQPQTVIPAASSSQQYPPMAQPIAPAPPPQLAAAAAVTATPTTSTGSTPRRTLTDADRRRMCIFHEENPNVKQTEIGGMVDLLFCR
jgi:hypothetical protein